MIKLKHIIKNGWNDNIKQLNDEIKIYFSYRDELHIQHGLLNEY